MSAPESVPDETIPYVREIEIYDDAEDVKRVRFIGDSKTVDVGITDLVMIEFLETAEEVFDEIHADMATMHDLLNQDQREFDREGDRT